jgi:hypothetical protein
VDASNFPSGVVGGALAALLMSWLATRAVRAARFRSGRYVVEYRLPIRLVAWFCLAIGLFAAYAASRASANQRVVAACVSSVMLLAGIGVFLDFHLVHVEFDDEFIYTFSPWRKRRVIPLSAVVGYRYSALNRWHILKTCGYGSIRLSELLSGLGTMCEKWESVLHHGPSNQSLEPAAGRCTKKVGG